MRMSIFRRVCDRGDRVRFAPKYECWASVLRISRCLNIFLLRRSAARNICDEPGLLTKSCCVGKVVQGRANGPFLLPAALRWEVVQLAVHQILDLIILVRVQASQPLL